MKRPRKGPDCFRALRVCDALSWGGGLVGFAALLGGWALGLWFVVCPHCGEPLYDFPRLPSAIPDYCPHCGQNS